MKQYELFILKKVRGNMFKIFIIFFFLFNNFVVQSELFAQATDFQAASNTVIEQQTPKVNEASRKTATSRFEDFTWFREALNSELNKWMLLMSMAFAGLLIVFTFFNWTMVNRYIDDKTDIIKIKMEDHEKTFKKHEDKLKKSYLESLAQSRQIYILISRAYEDSREFVLSFRFLLEGLDSCIKEENIIGGDPQKKTLDFIILLDTILEKITKASLYRKKLQEESENFFPILDSILIDCKDVEIVTAIGKMKMDIEKYLSEEEE